MEKDTEKKSILHKAPITNEDFLLTDAAQLRAVVKAVIEQLQAIADDPYILDVPGTKTALSTQYNILHAITCENCAELRRGTVEITDTHRNALKGLFKAYAEAADRYSDAPDNMDEEIVDALVASLYMGQRRSSILN